MVAGSGPRPPRCRNRQGEGGKLYRVPEGARIGPRPPEALCHFCFLRLVKRRPMSAEALPRGEQAG